MKQECVYKQRERAAVPGTEMISITGTEVITINLTNMCPFEYPCGKRPCECGKECPGRQDVKKHYPAPYFPPSPTVQPPQVVRESRTDDPCRHVAWE